MNLNLNLELDENRLSPQPSEEPIFSFPKLKDKLSAMGIVIGHAAPWQTVGTVDVLPEDIGTRILFENGGIYFFDDNGIKRRGFMYKTKFNFEWRGERRQPTFHVFKCTAIENFGNESFRFANAEPIKIYSKNENKEVSVEGMKLCNLCRNMLIEKEAQRVSSSTDFVGILKESGDVRESEQLELDIYGYVRNWEQISLAYRTKMDFTCERCGIHIQEGFDRQFIHTHHKNGIKTDNKESNLQCLCIKCHSEVDKHHRQKFSVGGNKVLLEEFMKKYEKI